MLALFETSFLFCFLLKYGKTVNYSGDEEGISCELPNFNLKFFDEPPGRSKRFTYLSKKELTHLLEQRDSENIKEFTNWSVTTFQGK